MEKKKEGKEERKKEGKNKGREKMHSLKYYYYYYCTPCETLQHSSKKKSFFTGNFIQRPINYSL